MEVRKVILSLALLSAGFQLQHEAFKEGVSSCGCVFETSLLSFLSPCDIQSVCWVLKYPFFIQDDLLIWCTGHKIIKQIHTHTYAHTHTRKYISLLARPSFLPLTSFDFSSVHVLSFDLVYPRQSKEGSRHGGLQVLRVGSRKQSKDTAQVRTI